jgi:hypothetical protein
LRAGPVRHRLHAGEEAALLDDQFVVDGGEDGVRHGPAAAWLGRKGAQLTVFQFPVLGLRNEDPLRDSVVKWLGFLSLHVGQRTT